MIRMPLVSPQSAQAGFREYAPTGFPRDFQAICPAVNLPGKQCSIDEKRGKCHCEEPKATTQSRNSFILEKAVNRRWTPINADRTRRYMSGNVHPTGASASGRNPINLFGILAFIGVHLRFQGLFQEVRDCFATRHAPLAADGSPQ